VSEPAFERRGGVAWIAAADGRALADALRAAERDAEVRCVVLTGGAFAADASSALARLRSTTLPTVAAVDGALEGPGAALLLTCDLGVAADGATVAFAPPAPGVAWDLQRAVGRPRAFELLATGRTVTAAELLELGLVTQVVPADELERAVEALAATFEAQAGAAVKRSLRFAELVDFDESAEFDRLLDRS
jgi:2-(1,2-epoxy-1,2-dihydrophenyl)acetyl-CoA isomerase